jgi:hypothetical protein
MSDEEYFRTCVARERHLAHLLGHHNVEEFYESAGTLWANTKELPKWTRDWTACGHLMTEYEIAISYHREAGHEHGSAVKAGTTVVQFSDHPSRDQAVRFAVVKAVIALLEHAGAGKHQASASP